MFSDPMANRVGSSNATPPSGAPGGPPGPGGPPSSIGGHQATQVPPTGLPPLGSSSSTSSATALLATATIVGPGQQGFTFPPLPQPPPPSFTGPLSGQLPPWLPGGQGQPGPMPYTTASGMPTASSTYPSAPLPMPGPGPFGPSSSSSSTAQGAPPPARQRFMAQGGDTGLPRWTPETPDARMMTAKGLTETKGKPPLFGQTLYKDVLAAKESYEDALAETRVSALHQDSGKVAQSLDDRLHTLGQAIARYLDKSPGDPVMKDLQDQIAGEKALLHLVRANPEFAKPQLNKGVGYSVQQAMELQRLGIAPGPNVTFDERHVDRRITHSNETFASGAINTVAKITYKGGEEKILKLEPTSSGRAIIDNTLGIPEDRPRYGNRNLATCAVDKFLGTGLTPTTEYAIHNGRLYLMMDLARGISGNGEETKVQLDESDPQHDLVSSAPRIPKNKVRDREEVLREAAANHGVDIVFNDDTTFVLLETKHTPYAVDYHDPQLAQALCNAELNDYITGQGDRHPGNYFIEIGPDGTFRGLTLIDDDASFGLRDDPQAIWLARQKGQQEGQGYKGVGMPLLFDKTTVAKICAPGAWQQLETDLSDLLTDDQMKAAKARFGKLVAHVSDPGNQWQIVSDWKAQQVLDPSRSSSSAPTPVQYLLANPSKSYLGRDNAVLQTKIQDGVTPLKLPKS
ncbi:MAG: hypothetical protein U1E53_08355 [Dongiaceae bacterium]